MVNNNILVIIVNDHLIIVLRYAMQLSAILVIFKSFNSAAVIPLKSLLKVDCWKYFGKWLFQAVCKM